jgi:hypothetical protein
VRLRCSKSRASREGKEVGSRGGEGVGRWWKVMEGMVAETEAMYGAVEPKWMGGVVTRMWMEIESDGWWLRMSLPSSTMEMRWPLPGDGYNTIVSICLWVLG